MQTVTSHAPALPALEKPRPGIEWSHLGIDGKPLPTLENVQCVIDAYQVVIARPPHCNTDDFTAWFGADRYQASAENQRDCQREKLRELCTLNGLDLRHDDVARYVTLLGMEQERSERKCSNDARLAAVGAL